MAKTLAPKEVDKWRAESDAHTLAEAKAIAADPKRLSAASAVAGKMAEEQMAQAKAMRAVARKSGKTGGKGGQKVKAKRGR